jgi:hypothetical protein
MRIFTRTAGAIGLAMALGMLSRPVPFLAQLHAASSKGCEGGGFSVLGVSGDRVTRIIPAAQVPNEFLVKGRYVEFTVVADSFGVLDWTLTGAANPLDITGGRRTIVFESKLPNHGTLSLTNDVAVAIDGDGIEISRTGPGLSMKLQAKDCANGGVFQMEPARADGARTLVTHVLDAAVFYFDNPEFRDRIGQTFPCVGCNGAVNDQVTVTARINRERLFVQVRGARQPAGGHADRANDLHQ